MPAQLRVLDSDETTVITSDNLGNVATPGSTSPTKYFINNFGTGEATGVTVSIEAVGTNDGDDYTQIAPDVSGSPGVFGVTPVDLGTIAALSSKAFWAQIVQPSGLTADLNPRRSNLVAEGFTV